MSEEDLAFHERQAMKDRELIPHRLSPDKPLETGNLDVDKAEDIHCESSENVDTPSSPSTVIQVESEAEEESPVLKNLDQLKLMIEDYGKVSTQVKVKCFDYLFKSY